METGTNFKVPSNCFSVFFFFALLSEIEQIRRVFLVERHKRDPKADPFSWGLAS
jgi:hypothetical protein